MKSIFKASLVLISTCAIAALTGCASPASGPQTSITTHAIVNGVNSAWANASLNGYATSGTYSCNPSSDQNCVVNFGSVNTDANGEYILESDALGGVTWTFSASDAPNTSTCPGEASETDIPNVGGNTDLNCNQNNGLEVSASPSSCVTTIMGAGGPSTTTCPASVVVTASQPIFPMGRAITATSYNEAEVQVSNPNNIVANSSTSIQVPTPTATGFTAIVFVDPTTNLVIGAAPFIFTSRTVGGCIPSPQRQCP
jgi:hypothetical protein